MQHEAIDLSQIKGRRARSRLRTCLPARVTTLADTRKAILIDLSLTGARFFLINPFEPNDAPKNGSEAVLEWETGEAFGSVIWSEGEVFGLEFDELLTAQILIETRELHDRLVGLGGLKYLEDQIGRKWVEGRAR